MTSGGRQFCADRSGAENSNPPLAIKKGIREDSFLYFEPETPRAVERAHDVRGTSVLRRPERSGEFESPSRYKKRNP